MARAFDQIYAELGSAFDPSAQLVQQQIAAIPGSTDALVAQADAKKTQAFSDITDGARRRGMGFSGIPLSEQAVYASTEYAPAIARVKGDAENRKVSLLEALNGMNRDRRTQAQGIYDNELTRELQERQFQEQIRQFNVQQAEARRQADLAAKNTGGGNYINPGGGNPGGGQQPQAPQGKAPSYGFKNGKNGASGFFFTDSAGRSISAAKYASLTGANLAQLISKMGGAGDKTAASLIKGPGVNMASKTYKSAFAWDM